MTLDRFDLFEEESSASFIMRFDLFEEESSASLLRIGFLRC